MALPFWRLPRSAISEIGSASRRGFLGSLCLDHRDTARYHVVKAFPEVSTLDPGGVSDLVSERASKRSRSITLVHARMKSFNNFSFESAHA